MPLNDNDVFDTQQGDMELTIDQIHAIQAHAGLKIARYREAEAMYETATASRHFEKAEVELNMTKMYQTRARNSIRPSMMLSAVISTDKTLDGRTIYTASAAGVTAQGDSPELAFQAFDELWSGANE